MKIRNKCTYIVIILFPKYSPTVKKWLVKQIIVFFLIIFKSKKYFSEEK